VKTPPGNWFAPPGSNQSSSGGNETAEASGAEGRFWRLGKHAGRNTSERYAGPEKGNAGADPPEIRGRPKLMESYERISFHQSCRGSGDGMQVKGIKRNTGSPSGESSTNQLATRERQAGPCGGGGGAHSTDEAG
jgi:hypothetical protein